MVTTASSTFNFNAGPSALPKAILEKAQNSMFNYKKSGLSVMEMSHRSPLYEEIHFGALNKVRSILSIPEEFDILLLQGGASLQFAMIPMNFLPKDKKAAYLMSGSWSEKALKEARSIGQAYELSTSKDNKYKSIPNPNVEGVEENTAYIHITSNNTIYGTQWPELPKEFGNQPVFVDASSDIFSQPIDWDHVDLVYAGAQKNAGPSGITVVIIRKELMEKANKDIPAILSYSTHAKGDSLYNTPPTAAIYMLGLMMDWLEEHGGINGIQNINEKKASLLYQMIDESNGFYKGHATKDSRSKMNVTFNLPTEELEKEFLNQAKARGFVGLNGHRSIGGCRASIYNGVPFEHVKKLVEFMEEFKSNNA
ncbi:MULTISPECIES: 3-phosphoserine/phosphohydroxythreonine transaminase [Bacillaceae]|uniref:Phosphoserine aminotransferase n=1 Tax=Evansella alkalicola TaxID=745819 RepID=A0ABS6JRK3_9BACI|nr:MULTISPECIES: 3-phosphoserine/phosphohydroxythreonine transaminase [Bacillaceae]MBU9720721.1 3-phosphoserine/phosphohydroxythreonine transaminase [Bacillus alkalicola]